MDWEKEGQGKAADPAIGVTRAKDVARAKVVKDGQYAARWGYWQGHGLVGGLSEGTRVAGTEEAAVDVRGICGVQDSENPCEQGGVTRYYDWTLTSVTIAPDGVPVNNTLLINGEYPGPSIEANWGDWIEIKLTNNYLDEGTSLHWHGLTQKGTHWNDGVPGVTTCPIAPGSSFTYRFQADRYGTSWWHSHVTAQYICGIQGAMIIYGPTQVEYDIDLGPILLTDWFHRDYYEMVQRIMAPHPSGIFLIPQLTADVILINGKMNYNCSLSNQQTNQPCETAAGLSKFKFTSGKKHRLRLINSGATAEQKFSIDGHNMTIIANDFVPITPYTTDLITLAAGQRADIIVEATGNPRDVIWMRAAVSPNCSLVESYLTAFAAIYYEDAPTDATPKSTSSITLPDIDTCGTDDIGLSTPMYIQPLPKPDLTIELEILLRNNGTQNIWYVNNSTYRADYNDPNLLEAAAGHTAFGPLNNMYNTGGNASVRIVMYNYLVFASHPMHLHGHNFYVLAQGFGEWDGVVQTDTANPLRRDTQMLGLDIGNATTSPENDFIGTPSYTVIQYDQDNPGLWPFHCHVSWHASDGLIITILESPHEITKLPILGTMAQLCREWADWTGDHVVDEIDSGL